jgi:hypothetical protein
MARRKRHHAKKHTTRRRRHSMSGVKGSASSILGLVGGGLLAYQVAKLVKSSTPSSTSATMGSYLANGIPVALGLYMPKILKSELGKNLGAGMIAAGGVGLANTIMPSLAGFGAMSRRNPYANRMVNPAPAVSGVKVGTGNYLAGIHGVACLDEMGE